MLGVSVNERLFFSAPVANMESTPRGAMEVSSTTLRGAMEGSSPTQQPRGAIAYLAQGVRHSTYGRDSLALLRRSLSLLYENYAAADAADTILFHRDDSDFPPAMPLRLPAIGDAISRHLPPRDGVRAAAELPLRRGD